MTKLHTDINHFVKVLNFDKVFLLPLQYYFIFYQKEKENRCIEIANFHIEMDDLRIEMTNFHTEMAFPRIEMDNLHKEMTNLHTEIDFLRVEMDNL